MSDSKKVDFNLKGLDRLIKAFGKKMPSVKVGILSGGDTRPIAGGSNAEIGRKHEFGKAGMPVRSFLRVPIAEHLEEFLKKKNAFDKDVQKRVVKSGSVLPWMELVAISCEDVVLEGFKNGGFGKWPRSRSVQTLVDTGQLRDSITSEVEGE